MRVKNEEDKYLRITFHQSMYQSLILHPEFSQNSLALGRLERRGTAPGHAVQDVHDHCSRTADDRFHPRLLVPDRAECQPRSGKEQLLAQQLVP